MGDRTGISDDVPALTPVRHHRCAVVSRRATARPRRSPRTLSAAATFAGPLPAAVTTAGASVLAGPVTLQLRRDGKPVAWRQPWVKLGKRTPTVARLVGGAVAPGLSLSGMTQVEFDGMIRVDLALRPTAGPRPDGVVLEIPLKAQHARYLYHFPGQWGSVANSGRCRRRMAARLQAVRLAGR